MDNEGCGCMFPILSNSSGIKYQPDSKTAVKSDSGGSVVPRVVPVKDVFLSDDEFRRRLEERKGHKH